MAKTKEQKKKIIQDLKEKIDKQKSIVFVAIEGLKAEEVFDLREKLKEKDCLLTVAKKTFLDIILKEKKIKIDNLDGQLALVFGFADEIMPAKISYNFSKTNENLKLLGGIFENKFIGEDQILSLAKLLSKEELYAKVVGTLNAPITNFVGVLKGNLRGLVYLLSSIKKTT